MGFNSSAGTDFRCPRYWPYNCSPYIGSGAAGACPASGKASSEASSEEASRGARASSADSGQKIGGGNFGAFVFSPLWALFNLKIWLSVPLVLLSYLGPFILFVMKSTYYPKLKVVFYECLGHRSMSDLFDFAGVFLFMWWSYAIIAILLFFKGNDWAWKYPVGKLGSVDGYIKAQRIWKIFAFFLFIPKIIFMWLVSLVYVFF